MTIQDNSPLAGITVLDLTEGVAGPYATSVLGDMGADVIKIERPQGDWGRVTGAVLGPDFGSVFVSMNRNKRCLGLDLKAEAGRAVVRKILERADVVISNYRRGVMDDLGFGYEDCVAVRPNIVYCTIAAYDPKSPNADHPGNDTGLQAASGLMSLTGFADGEPLRTAIPIVDMTAGIFAAQGILAGLVRRDQPRLVEVSLLNVALALEGIPMAEYLTNGVLPRRHGNQNPFISPAGAYVAKDGKFFTVSCLRQEHWVSLCNVLGRGELAENPLFADNSLRVENRAALNAELDQLFATKSRAEWVGLLRSARVLHAAVYDFADVVSDPGTGPTMPIAEVNVGGAMPARAIANPVRYDREFPAVRVGAPLRGEHSVELLTELGLSAGEIRSLLDDGVVAQSTEEREPVASGAS